MKLDGIRRHQQDVQKKLDRGIASNTDGGVAIIRQVLSPVIDKVAETLATAETENPTRRPELFRKAGYMDPGVLAYLTAKVVLDRAAANATLLRTALGIGSAIEDEQRLAAFEEQEPKLYRTLVRSMRQRGSSPEHARVVWSTSADKADVDIPRWSRREKVRVGLYLFDLFSEASGLAIRELVPVGTNRFQWKVTLTPSAYEWLQDYNDKAGLLRPAYMPTVEPPVDWSATRGGGYHTSSLFSLPLVKRTFRSHVEALKAADLSTVYAGLNAMQRTPWRVNTPVLDTMRRAWESGSPLRCLPRREDQPPPPKPVDIGDNEDVRRAWKQQARQVYETNAKEKGARFEMSRLLTLASDLSGCEAIYFPHQLDFRGRGYSVPIGLQPQGADESKALLTFARGKPLNGSGYWWLNVHGANVFGFDKASLQERAEWGQAHRQRAQATTQDPFADLWWTEADKPWSFLAWCFEVSRNDGASSLPIALDGSCNGLQHFSAMLRDPVGGAAVNLVPSDTPQDIYQRVADRTVELLRDYRGEHEWWARAWYDFGIDRKITKRPVMVLPYGGTRMSCLEYIRLAVQERIDDGAIDPFGLEMYRATAFLSGVVWEAIGDVVVAARRAMAWLRQVARLAASAGKPLTWTTPSGFVAHQEYRDFSRRLITTKMRGKITRLVDFGETDSLDGYRQGLGISPNFVHSLDASAMMLTIVEAQASGVEHFAMIHDSYGTLASDTDALATSLRKAFVSMYENHNVLQEFADDVLRSCPGLELPPLPPMGSLDIQQVRSSPYFFA